MNRILVKILLILMSVCLWSCSSVTSPTIIDVNSSPAPGNEVALWNNNTETIWYQLQHTSLSKLAAMQSTTSDPVKSAWLNLALISKQNHLHTQPLAKALLAWREQHPTHPANRLIPRNTILIKLAEASPPQRIALLLPQQGAYVSSAQKVREGFLNAYYTNLPNVGKQNVKFYDTSEVKDIGMLYQKAQADGADLIIGPLLKNDVRQLRSFRTFRTPTLALNYSDVSFGSLPQNFYEFGLSPEDEVLQTAQKAYKAGYSKAIVIAPQTLWGKRLTTTFRLRWLALGGNIQDTWYYPAKVDFNAEVARLMNVDPNIDKELMQEVNDRNILEQQRRQDFDVIFLFAQPKEARIIVPLLRYYYANNIPIYSTSALYAGKSNLTKDADLNGVIVCDIPWKNLNVKTTHSQSDRLYAVGQDAYLLSQSLTRMVLLPNFPVYGATGALNISPTNQIHRRIPCIPIRDGLL